MPSGVNENISSLFFLLIIICPRAAYHISTDTLRPFGGSSWALFKGVGACAGEKSGADGAPHGNLGARGSMQGWRAVLWCDTIWEEVLDHKHITHG